MHALIIEDDSRIGLAIWSLLQSLGFESVTIAQTEKAAMADALRERPDFITCDVHLKEGLGTRAAHLIRKMHGPVPMVYITASPADIADSDPSAPIIVKPFSPRALFDVLKIVGVEVDLSVTAARDQGWRSQIFAAH
ncbi:response regulator [Sphingobium sufflavum]|uniref:response regulator n=1 Tax=Sphingobium sufflavum TaxID=1129547 RepID=UPI001F3EB5CF|nr:response regulator [Sphingobium sufflavum]MCE7798904.1 response regulator [Sphingobium sufflavum]